jgi:hypothetical protein
MILSDNQLKAYEYGLAHHPNLNQNCKIFLEKDILKIEMTECNSKVTRLFKHDNTKAGLVALLKSDEIKSLLGFDFSNLIAIMCIR